MTETKRSGFWKAFLIYALVLLVVFAAALTVFWFYIASFEKSRPELTAKEYTDVQSADFWRKGVAEAIRAGNEFERKELSAKDYGIDLSDGFELSQRREKSPDENSESYVLSVGGANIARLTLKKSGSAGFGFSTWVVAKCEFLAGNARTLTIVAPDYAVVTVNGVAVPEKYITDRESVFEVETEHPFDRMPSGVTYTVADLHGPLEAKADDGEGTELKAGEPKGGAITFLPAALRSFRCCAPAGTEVRVNGEALPDSYANVQISDMMEELSRYMDNSAVFYSCDGLMSEPELSCADAQGRELEPIIMDDGLISFVPESSALLPLDMTPTVEGFIRSYVAFSANLEDDIEKNYERLAAYLVSGTELASRIYQTQEALYWVGGASVRYNSLDIHDYIPLGSGCAACLVDYDIVNRTGYENREVKARCTLIMIHTGGYWHAAGMVVE